MYFITAYLNLMFSGPQEFCVCCIPLGLAMMFTAPMPARKASPLKTRKRQAKKRAAPARKQTKKAKAKREKRPYSPPPLSPEQSIMLFNYLAKRDGIDG